MVKSARSNARRSGGAARAPDPSVEHINIPIEQRVGTIIRRKRKELGLTLADLGSVADVSSAMMSRIENGQAAASLDVLERISNALGTNMSTLFKEIEVNEGTAQLIKAADQMEVVRSGTRHGHTYKLLAYQRGPRQQFEPFLIEMDRDSEIYPRFQHPGTEFIYMLSGRMEYQFGDKTFLIEPGDAFTFSGQVEHGPATLLDDKIRFLTTIIYDEE